MLERFNVIGCAIIKTTMDGAINSVCQRVESKMGGYVCFTNVHASVMAGNDASFMSIVNNSFMSLPDGKPVYWVGRLLGNKGIEQIPGPDFFEKLLAHRGTPELKHYFYGGKPEILEMLVEKLKARYSSINIVGMESPPFRQVSDEEMEMAIERINSTRPDIVWIGLGAPKQENWMSDHWQQLKPAVLLGVGAAFDFHADAVKRAPLWMQKIGLEWFHRLMQEPGRLWKRYLYTNTVFLWRVIKQFINRMTCVN